MNDKRMTCDGSTQHIQLSMDERMTIAYVDYSEEKFRKFIYLQWRGEPIEWEKRADAVIINGKTDSLFV